MRFSDHARVDVPASKSARLDVLRAERLGQCNRSLNVISICFRLNASPLLLVERPVAVELKAAVRDARTRKPASRDRIGIRHQRRHRRSLIANRGNAEVDKTGKPIRAIRVCMKIDETRDYCSTAT